VSQHMYAYVHFISCSMLNFPCTHPSIHSSILHQPIQNDVQQPQTTQCPTPSHGPSSSFSLSLSLSLCLSLSLSLSLVFLIFPSFCLLPFHFVFPSLLHKFSSFFSHFLCLREYLKVFSPTRTRWLLTFPPEQLWTLPPGPSPSRQTQTLTFLQPIVH